MTDVTGGRDRSNPAPKSEIGETSSKGPTRGERGTARDQQKQAAWHRCMQVFPVPVQPNQVLGPPLAVYTPQLVPMMPASPSLTPTPHLDWSGSGHSKMVWGGVPAREASYHSLGGFDGPGTEASNPAPLVPLPLMVGGGAVAGGHFFRDISVLRKSNSNDSIHSDGCAPALPPQPPCPLPRPRFAPLLCDPPQNEPCMLAAPRQAPLPRSPYHVR